METPAALAGGATDASASSSSSSQPGATTSSSTAPPAPVATAARKRTPGRWRRTPREQTPALIATKAAMKARKVLGIIDWEAKERNFLRMADEMEAIDANECDCDTEEDKIAFMAFRDKEVARFRKIAKNRPEDMVLRPIKRTDTWEEQLTAEEMEARFEQNKACHTTQAQHFAKLALAHYNDTKTTQKFKLSKALASNCFSEECGTTYAHVNFTAIPKKAHPNDDTDHGPITRRLFFTELMFVNNLEPHEDTEPMRVLHVSTIDDVPCYGGCQEINHTMRGDKDYECCRACLGIMRCHACHDILKHPRGVMFIGGHDITRRPYYSET